MRFMRRVRAGSRAKPSDPDRTAAAKCGDLNASRAHDCRRDARRRRRHHLHRHAADRAGASAARPLHRGRRIASARRRAWRDAAARLRANKRAAGRSYSRRRLQSRRHAACARRAPCRASPRHPGRSRRSRLERAPAADAAVRRLLRRPSCASVLDRLGVDARHRGRPFLGRRAGGSFRARSSAARRRSRAARAAALSALPQHDLALRGLRDADRSDGFMRARWRCRWARRSSASRWSSAFLPQLPPRVYIKRVPPRCSCCGRQRFWPMRAMSPTLKAISRRKLRAMPRSRCRPSS